MQIAKIKKYFKVIPPEKGLIPLISKAQQKQDLKKINDPEAKWAKGMH